MQRFFLEGAKRIEKWGLETITPPELLVEKLI